MAYYILDTVPEVYECSSVKTHKYLESGYNFPHFIVEQTEKETFYLFYTSHPMIIL